MGSLNAGIDFTQEPSTREDLDKWYRVLDKTRMNSVLAGVFLGVPLLVMLVTSLLLVGIVLDPHSIGPLLGYAGAFFFFIWWRDRAERKALALSSKWGRGHNLKLVQNRDLLEPHHGFSKEARELIRAWITPDTAPQVLRYIERVSDMGRPLTQCEAQAIEDLARQFQFKGLTQHHEEQARAFLKEMGSQGAATQTTEAANG